MDLMTKLAIGLGIMMGVVWVFGRNQPRGETKAAEPAPPSDPETLEEKLERLASFGWTLAPGITVDDLLEQYARPDLEAPGYELLLVTLGGETDDGRWQPHCEQVWHFDTECIEGPGSYVRIAERVAGMVGPELVLTDVRDHVDDDGEEASLSFTCGGQSHTWPLTFDHDWVDPKVFTRFVKLVKTQAPDRLLLYFDLGGQDCLLACADRNRLSDLEALIPGIEPLA